MNCCGSGKIVRRAKISWKIKDFFLKVTIDRFGQKVYISFHNLQTGFAIKYYPSSSVYVSKEIIMVIYRQGLSLLYEKVSCLLFGDA
jgi:hypothetical protein